MTTFLVVVVLVLVVVAGALVVADHLVRTRMVEQVRRAVEDAARAPTRLDVPHRPLLPHAAQRLIPTATVTFTDLPIAEGRARIGVLVVDLERLHLTGPRLRPGIRVDRGTFRATLGVDAVNALVTLPPGLQRVELNAERIRLRTVAGVAIDTSVDLTRRGIRVTGTGGLLKFLPTAGWTVPWPSLPYGATIHTVRAGDRSLELTGTLHPSALEFRR